MTEISSSYPFIDLGTHYKFNVHLKEFIMDKPDLVYCSYRVSEFELKRSKSNLVTEINLNLFNQIKEFFKITNDNYIGKYNIYQPLRTMSTDEIEFRISAQLINIDKLVF